MSATRSPTAAIYHKYAQRDIYQRTQTGICVCGSVCICVCVWHINPTLVFATRDLCAASRLAVAFCLCRCQRSFNSTLAPCGRSVCVFVCVYLLCVCECENKCDCCATYDSFVCPMAIFIFTRFYFSRFKIVKLSNKLHKKNTYINKRSAPLPLPYAL